MPEAASEARTSLDAILGGGLRLRQFVRGHRIGADAVLLAAAAGAPARHLVDVGTGVGAVGLALLQRWPDARGDLIEIDDGLAALARGNAALNGLDGRARILCVDALSARLRREAGLADGEADLVVTNPPFFDAATVRASPDPRRARAHVAASEGGLEAWISAALALLAPGGRFVMIHRADALAAILAAFGKRVGAGAVRPVHPSADAPAIRALIAAVKGSKAPLRILPGLALNEASGAFTPFAEAVHRGAATIDWPS